MEINDSYSIFAQVYEDRKASGFDFVPRLVERFYDRLPPRSLVLDAGCGPGIEAAVGIARGHRIIGLDFSDEMAKRFRERHPDQACLHASLEQIPLADAHVDAVLISFSLVHMNDGSARQALRECRRVLKPGGRVGVFIGGFAEDVTKLHLHREAFGLGLEPIPFAFRSEASLRALFGAAGFEIAEWNNHALAGVALTIFEVELGNPISRR